MARAVEAGDAAAVHARDGRARLPPGPGGVRARSGCSSSCGSAGEWYFEPGPRRITPAYVSDLMERSSSPRSEYFDDLRRMSLPPQALLIRRMEGLVFSTLGELRARADWAALGARVPRRRRAGDRARRADAAFWNRGPLARAA